MKTAIVQWRNRASAGDLDPIASEVIANVIAGLVVELDSWPLAASAKEDGEVVHPT